MTDAALGLPALALDQQRPSNASASASAHWWTAQPALLGADLLAATIAGWLAATTGSLVLRPEALGLLLACWGACLVSARATVPTWVESRARFCRRVARAGCWTALAGTASSLMLSDRLTTHDVFTLAALWTALSCGLRLGLPSLGAGAEHRGPPLVVVGRGEHGRHATAMLERRVGTAVPVVQVDASTPDDRTDGPIGLDIAQVAAYARQVQAGAVVAIPGSGLDASSLRRLQWELERGQLPLYVDPGVLGIACARLLPASIGDLAVVRIQPARRGLSWRLIGCTSRAAATVGLIALLPTLLVIALAIRCTSPGPAIYRQVRVGQDGRTFTIFKFRTMDAGRRTDAVDNDFDDVLFKMRSDPRVTPLGRHLRRYSLDELPQLANVVLGQMRLIGPRPALPDEVAVYSDDARRRLAVKPGITGLWQVSGRSDLTWEETVRLDLHYVDNWSPCLDLAILCRTIGAVVGHRGAY